MSLGQGAIYSMSSKQKLNTQSSTEAELIGVNDAMAMVLCTHHFLKVQGYHINDNVVPQDNKNTMKLAKFGKQSSGHQTHHLEVHFSFVTNNMQRQKLWIEYCPTRDMLVDFFTKPLQRLQFQKLKKLILNLEEGANALPPTLGEQECVGTDAVTLQSLVSFPTACVTQEILTRQGNMNMTTKPHNNHISYADIMWTPQNSHHQNSKVSEGASHIPSLCPLSMPPSHSV